MWFIHSPEPLDLTGKTILIPVVSTANVGQLAVDLIIASFSLTRVAILNPTYCVPVVGAREDGQKGITTPLELYSRSNLDFVVVQQRSPVLKSRKQDFIDALLDFVKLSKFAAVLFVSGVDLSNRTDGQMMTPTYQLHPPNGPSLAATPLRNLSSLPIPVYTSPVQQQPQNSAESLHVPFIPGGGLTRRILESLPSEWSIATACLLQFVLEGDNRADAMMLANVITKVINQDTTQIQWTQPSSWRDGLFGTPHDQTLYG
ncbi:PAC2 family-domain-containing protein [Crassisporium funariophilum]|nr:PAC2 family-domain-containing protein [Crassisporium funariophilum]